MRRIFERELEVVLTTGLFRTCTGLDDATVQAIQHLSGLFPDHITTDDIAAARAAFAGELTHSEELSVPDFMRTPTLPGPTPGSTDHEPIPREPR
ncbi:hypothetical protein [Nocardia thailandica]|uniref:hypothetical protein n=1 Tax=Nocardia thailandica TaxID=257275 RepID=UPI0005BCC200|nr:hypothetical protein [Nocardia thailandica]